MREYCHGIKIFPQPSPSRNAGGDCFACAIKATMDHIYKENAPSFDQVWESFLVDYEHDGNKSTHLSNTWHGYRGAFYNLFDIVGRMEIMCDFAGRGLKEFGYGWGDSMGWQLAVDESQWAKRLDAWLRAGWYAFASIRLEPNPTGEWVLTDEGPRRVSTDHFVALDGVRFGWRKHSTVEGASSLVSQVHVVCSAKGGQAYWIDVEKFIREHGAGAWWLIRPGDYGTLEE
jgi:hypothetical protein